MSSWLQKAKLRSLRIVPLLLIPMILLGQLRQGHIILSSGHESYLFRLSSNETSFARLLGQENLYNETLASDLPEVTPAHSPKGNASRSSNKWLNETSVQLDPLNKRDTSVPPASNFGSSLQMTRRLKHEDVYKKSRVEYRVCPACLFAQRVDCPSLTEIMATKASLLFAKMKQSNCTQCDPRTCRVLAFRRILPDDAVPEIQWGVTYETMPSMKRQRRDGWNGTTGPKAHHFSAYNPSIVPLPNITIESLLAEGAQFDSPPTYLASFRVTTLTSCAPKTWVPADKNEHINLVGLALLDDKLNMLRDVVIDANRRVHIKQKKFEDVRLFILKGVLYLSQAYLLMPIQVTAPTKGPKKKSAYVFDNVWGDGLVISIPSRFPARTRILTPRDFAGKNYNFFTVGSRVFMEHLPYPHDGVKEITNIDSRFDDPRLISLENSNQAKGKKTATRALPLPSGNTLSPYKMLKVGALSLMKHRGSACCVDLESKYFPDWWYGKETSLKVGILHVKNHNALSRRQEFKNAQYKFLYLSRFYAFAPKPPSFDDVALSAYFCLTRPPMTNRTVSSVPLTIGLDCPMVHFISSMTVNPQNSSQVIIAYGIDDCSSNFVVIDKTEIARLLFTAVDESS